MFGKIIDMNNTDAFVNLLDGTTMDISVSRLPKNSKIGDSVDLNIATPTNMAAPTGMQSNKMGNLF